MKRKRILVAGIVLAVFCLGIIVGRRGARSPGGASSSASRYSSPGSAAPCVDFHDAASRAGQVGCVSGRLVKVFTSRGGNTFLDFCEDYHNCPFASVIFSSDKGKFGDLEYLAGRRIEIRGSIRVYQGKPEIVISDPEQIRLAE